MGHLVEVYSIPEWPKNPPTFVYIYLFYRETELKLRGQELESHVGILQGAFDNANKNREEAMEHKSSMQNE